jgi:hypothetical protein
MLNSIIDNSQTFLNHCFLKFTCGILLTQQKKTIPSLAKNLNSSTNELYRILKNQKPLIPFFPQNFFAYIKSFSKEGYFVIDDSTINKQFSKQIQGTSEVFDTIMNRALLGFSVVTLAWTDGITTIPLRFALWYNKDVAQDDYKTKVVLAKELIDSIPSSIEHKGLIFDGLYATKEMIIFLRAKKIRFVARAATNKVITYQGVKAQLKKHTALKFRRNEHSRTIKAQWHELELYFTVEKRKDKHGEITIVFLVSNFQTVSSDYVHIYRFRWGIEVFYRTAKQSLGLKDCQSTDLNMQKIRLYNLFYTYAFLQHQKKLRKASNVESVIRSLQLLKEEDIMLALDSFNQLFHQNG